MAVRGVLMRTSSTPAFSLRPTWLAIVLDFGRMYPLGGLSLVLLLLVLAMALAAPLLATHDPLAQNTASALRPPGGEFWLGTDTFGRDSWSRLIYGSRVTLSVGIASVLVASVLGVVLGSLSAYVGGWFDLWFQRVVDTFLGFPALVFAMVIVLAVGASVKNVIIVIGVTLAPGMIRISRASALAVIQEPYVEAARATGAATLRVIFRHVVPNSLTPVFVVAAGQLGTAILAEAGLSFLGFGVPPPEPSWGGMLRDSIQLGHLQSAPWLAIFPGIALSILVFSFALLGDALRDALDPRLT